MKLSEKSIEILDSALAEAFWHKQNFACVEYILLGLSRNPDEEVAKHFAKDELNYHKTLSSIESYIGSGCLTLEEEVFFTPIAVAVIEHAAEKAKSNSIDIFEGELVVEPEHLISALISDSQNGLAKQALVARIIEDLNLTSKTVRHQSKATSKLSQEKVVLRSAARRRVEKALSQDFRRSTLETTTDKKIEELMRGLIGFIKANDISPEVRNNFKLPSYDSLIGVYLSGDADFVILSKSGIYWSNEDLNALFVPFEEIDSFRLIETDSSLGLEIQSGLAPPLVLVFANDKFTIHNDRQESIETLHQSRASREFTRNSIRTVKKLPELCQWLLDGHPDKETIDRLELNIDHFNHSLLEQILELTASSKNNFAQHPNPLIEEITLESDNHSYTELQSNELDIEREIPAIEKVKSSADLFTFLQSRTNQQPFLGSLLIDLQYMLPSQLDATKEDVGKFCRLVALLLSAPYDESKRF